MKIIKYLALIILFLNVLTICIFASSKRCGNKMNLKFREQQPVNYWGIINGHDKDKFFHKNDILVVAISEHSKEVINCVYAESVLPHYKNVKTFDFFLPINTDVSIYQVFFMGKIQIKETRYNQNRNTRYEATATTFNTSRCKPKCPTLKQPNYNDSTFKTTDELLRKDLKYLIEVMKRTGLTSDIIYFLKKQKLFENKEVNLKLISDVENTIREISITKNKLNEQEILEQDRLWRMLDRIIETKQSNGTLTNLQMQTFYNHIKDEKLPLSATKDAILAVSKQNMSAEIKANYLSYFKGQVKNSQSEVFAPASVALFKLGNRNDKKKVVNGIFDKNWYRSTKTMEMIGELDINQDSNEDSFIVLQITKISRNQKTNPIVIETSINSLGNLYKRNPNSTVLRSALDSIQLDSRLNRETNLEMKAILAIPPEKRNDNQKTRLRVLRRNIILQQNRTIQ